MHRKLHCLTLFSQAPSLSGGWATCLTLPWGHPHTVWTMMTTKKEVEATAVTTTTKTAISTRPLLPLTKTATFTATRVGGAVATALEGTDNGSRC